jgi:GST-like protein
VLRAANVKQASPILSAIRIWWLNGWSATLVWWAARTSWPARDCGLGTRVGHPSMEARPKHAFKMNGGNPMIELYFWPTGNGKKVVILLEELELPYTIKPINIGRGDQLTPEFLKISPNGRMPTIVDTEPMGGGDPISIFESGAIMTYLAEKTGRFCPVEPRGKYDVAQWVSWQLANQGPKLGEQGHFRRALESGNNGDLSYAIRRFDNEAHRIFGVMNLGLFNKRYLAAGEYTIADMICYPWASSWATRKIDIDEFPNVKRWLEEMTERPAVKKAMAMGPEFREDPASISAEEQARRRRLVADQRAQPIPSDWVRATQG